MMVWPAGAALAASSPWAGTWKLDQAQSHFAGGTMSITKGAGGLLHYADGTTVEYDFSPDGKERKYWANSTAVWTSPRKNTWDAVIKLDGKDYARGHLVLSAEGKTLTQDWTAYRPDGSTQREVDVMTRVSGSSGLVGTWRSTKVEGGGGPREFVIDVPAEGRIHYRVADMKLDVDARTDGTDTAMTGPTAAPGLTIAFQAINPTTTRYTMKVDGKVDSMGEQTLAADGRSFTDVNWTPGKEDEKSTAVYVKQ
ncbi:MAG: hypothetical protein JSR15_09870 [Proteobacteria bacterium]|nr:hypothetical protein [Pseudomonadota bacterium]